MNFIKRNLPVFIIGAVTLGIFLVIIVLGAKNQRTDNTQLVQVGDSELITAHTYTLGDASAPVTLVEFSDFQCPACKLYQPVVRSLYEKYPQQLRVAYRHFPLPQHPFARKAAEAAQAAGAQGKFWEYGDKLFENNDNLTVDDMLGYAKDLGLDTTKFKDALDKNTYVNDVNDDIKMATNLRLGFTPSFILNGKLLNPNTPDDFENIVLTELAKYTKVEPNNANTPIAQPTNTPQSTDTTQKTTVLQISFTDTGFTPQNATGKLGQTVRFTNNTSTGIILQDDDAKMANMKGGVKLAANQTFEVTLKTEKLWSFSEGNSQKTGTIYVYP